MGYSHVFNIYIIRSIINNVCKVVFGKIFDVLYSSTNVPLYFKVLYRGILLECNLTTWSLFVITIK